MPADRAPGGTSNYVKACFPAYASGSVAGNSPDLPTELNCVAAIAGAPAAFKVPPGTASFDPHSHPAQPTVPAHAEVLRQLMASGNSQLVEALQV